MARFGLVLKRQRACEGIRLALRLSVSWAGGVTTFIQTHILALPSTHNHLTNS